MTDFKSSFERMIENEGGYVLHEVEGDRGGMTFGGISRHFNPDWLGWSVIDSGDWLLEDLKSLVRSFYHRNYWDRIRGDEFSRQEVADTVFDFAVNSGVKTASTLAQLVVGAKPDGIIGSKTLKLLNLYDSEDFKVLYALAKVKRYSEIVNRDKSQSKFLLGWINRTLRGLE